LPEHIQKSKQSTCLLQWQFREQEKKNQRTKVTEGLEKILQQLKLLAQFPLSPLRKCTRYIIKMFGISANTMCLFHIQLIEHTSRGSIFSFKSN